MDKINQLEDEVKKLSDEDFKTRTAEWKQQIEKGRDLDEMLPEVFAHVREAGWRSLKMRHYDVQLIGGIVLHQGKIAEMKTGEGKTLVATLPAVLNGLTGKGVHVVTVNDYLQGVTPNGWASFTISWAFPQAPSCTGWTTSSARSPTGLTSPTEPTTSSGSTTCATT